MVNMFMGIKYSYIAISHTLLNERKVSTPVETKIQILKNMTQMLVFGFNGTA